MFKRCPGQQIWVALLFGSWSAGLAHLQKGKWRAYGFGTKTNSPMQGNFTRNFTRGYSGEASVAPK